MREEGGRGREEGGEGGREGGREGEGGGEREGGREGGRGKGREGERKRTLLNTCTVQSTYALAIQAPPTSHAHPHIPLSIINNVPKARSINKCQFQPDSALIHRNSRLFDLIQGKKIKK